MSCESHLKNCQLYSEDQAPMMALQEEEYKSLKLHCQFDQDEGCLVAKYPFSRDPSILVDNGKNALVFQERQEKKQHKTGTHAKYVEQFEDMLAHGVISVIPTEELKSYRGPVNYITHQEVYKDSSTTPVRVISNSSFHNRTTTLNKCLIKGPNTLVDLYKNLIKFRGYE